MYLYLIGLLVGLGSGIAIGLYLGQKKKSQEELTPRERKTRIITIISGSIILTAGIIILIIMIVS